MSVRTATKHVVLGNVVAACCWSDGERVGWLSFAEPQGPGAGQGSRGSDRRDVRWIILGRRHRLGIVYGTPGRALTAAQQALLAALEHGRLEVEPLPGGPGDGRSRSGDAGNRAQDREGPAGCIPPRFSARFRRPSGVSTARRRLQRLLTEDGYFPELIRRVALAATEAMINAVRYAGAGHIDVYASPRRIVAVVTDKGPGIAFEKLARTLLEPRDRYTVGRGHGYWLMVALSSQCRVCSGPGGTRVELLFDVEERGDRHGG
ncbi:MAG TPA: ATP-binding protein [Thermaerobacter sp.]